MNLARSLLAFSAFALPLGVAHAASVPVASPSAATTYAPVLGASYDPARDIARNHDDYYYDRYRRRNRVRTGDVIAGVVVIGTIAALLASRNKDRSRNRDRDDRNRDYRDRDGRYRSNDRDYRAGRGIDGAVERCVDEVERDGRVESIDNATRDGTGWVVSGRMSNGSRYRCELGNDGRIRDIDITDSRYGTRGDRRDDDYYARARRDAGTGGPEARADAEDSRLRDWSFEEDDGNTTFAGVQ